MSPEGEKLMKAVVLAQVERENAKLYEMAIKNLQRGQKTVGRCRSLTPPSSSDRTPTPSPSPPPSPVRKKKGKKKKKMKMKMKMRKEDEEVKDEEVKDEDEEDEERRSTTL